MKSLFLFILLVPQFAFAQHSVGGGGKGFNGFLTDGILEIDKLLTEECDKNDTQSKTWHDLACNVPAKLFDQIVQVKIMNDYIVYARIDHKPRDAVNDVLPSGEHVVIYSKRILKFSQPDERRRVLLHEFMTLAGFETTDSYGYSTLVLNFISERPEFKAILSVLPIDNSNDERTFRSLDTTIWDGENTYPVIIESTDDYHRFCVAQGFGDVVSTVYLSDVSYGEWMKTNHGHPEGAVLLNDDGLIIHVEQNPAKNIRVINTITCK